MSTTLCHSPTRAPNRRHRGAAWTKTLVVAVIPWLVSVGGHGQAPTVSKTASTNGLQAKFVVVKAFGADINTRYYEGGQGEPMVLVHGGGFSGHPSANYWDRNIAGLSKRFHVFAADKLAAGMTDNPPDDKDYNIQGEVEHMYQFIQTMKLGKVHLVGQSRGAGLSLMLAVAHPEVVKTLVLVDSGTASPEEACPGCAQAIRARCSAAAPGNLEENWRCLVRTLSPFNPTIAFNDEWLAAAWYMELLPKSKTTLAKMAAGAGEPLGSQFGDFKKKLHQRLRNEALLPMPTLLYWAVDDPQAPALKNGAALYEILAEKHPNVRLLITNKAGHFHFREYPDEFDYNVINFIEYWNRHSTGTTATRSR